MQGEEHPEGAALDPRAAVPARPAGLTPGLHRPRRRKRAQRRPRGVPCAARGDSAASPAARAGSGSQDPQRAGSWWRPSFYHHKPYVLKKEKHSGKFSRYIN